jgi:hypothetical protein
MEKIIVKDDDAVLRRIPNKPSHFKKDGTLSSANFVGPNTSVNIERLTTIEETLVGYKNFGLVRLLTGFIRELGADVVHDPIENNYSHAIIPGKRSAHVARKLANMATMVIVPNLDS